MTSNEEWPPCGNETAGKGSTDQGDRFRVQGRPQEQAPVIGVTVTLDLSDLEHSAYGWADVRSRLWNSLVDLPAGTLVRLSVGRVLPMPESAHTLGIGHVLIAIESPSWRNGIEWRSRLNGAPA